MATAGCEVRLALKSQAWLHKPRSAFGVASQEIKEYSRLGNPGDVTLRVNEDNILLWKAYVKARSLLLASCSSFPHTRPVDQAR